jgi:hypothetical protein
MNAMTIIAAATLASISVGAAAVADNSKKLFGSQIRARFAGMQLTDEVHFRDVYDREGKLRSYSMGKEKVGKWAIEGRALSLFQGTGRWLLRSVAFGAPR